MKRFKGRFFMLVLVLCAGLLLTTCGNQAGDKPATADEEIEQPEEVVEEERAEDVAEEEPKETDEVSEEKVVPATVTVDFADEDFLATGDYEEFVLEDDDFSAQLVFRTDKTVTDFTVEKLDFHETDDGIEFYGVEKYTTLPELSPEKPFVLTMLFHGSLPDVGITYMDGGEVYSFYPQESGKDGSVSLVPYK